MVHEYSVKHADAACHLLFHIRYDIHNKHKVPKSQFQYVPLRAVYFDCRGR